MFVGTFNLTVDRCRILLPPDIFSQIGASKIILFLDEKKRRVIFYGHGSIETFGKSLPSDADRLPARMARMLANGHRVRVDNKKRLSIPTDLAKKVGIAKMCRLIGQGHFCVLKA